MAESTGNKVVFDIEIKDSDAIKRIADIAKQQRALKEENKELSKSFDQNSEAITANNIRISLLGKESTNLKKQVVDGTKANKENTGSLVDMRNQLKLLNTQYDNLSKSERENANIGGKLQEQIKGLTKDITGLEEGTGRAQRNVGGYRQAIEDSIKSTSVFGISVGQVSDKMGQLEQTGGLAGKGVGALNAAFRFLLANPIVLIIAGIVAIFAKLASATDFVKDKIEQFTAGIGAGFNYLVTAVNGLLTSANGVKGFGDIVSDAFTIIIAPIKAIITGLIGFGKAIDALVKGDFTQVKAIGVETFDALGKQVNETGKSVASLVDVGKTLVENFAGLAAGAKNAALAQLELTKQLQDLEDAEDRNNLALAKSEKAVSSALIAVKNRSLSEREKINILKEAGALEVAGSTETLRIAKERLGISIQEVQNSKAGLKLDNDRIVSLSGNAKALNSYLDGLGLQDAEIKKIIDSNVNYIKSLESTENVQDRVKNRIIQQEEAEKTRLRKEAEDRAGLNKSLAEDRVKQLEDEGEKQIELLKIQQKEELRLKIQHNQDLISDNVINSKKAGEYELELRKRQADELADLESKISLEAFAKRKAEFDKSRKEDEDRRKAEYTEAEKLNAQIFGESQNELKKRLQERSISTYDYETRQLAIEELQLRTQLELRKSYGEQTLEVEQKLVDNRLKIDKLELEQKKKIENAKLSVATDVAKSLTSLGKLLGKNAEEQAEFQKAAAIIQLTVDTVKSISATIAGASEAASAGGPAAPFLLAAYIASGIATVIGAFAQAKSLLNFELGGDVSKELEVGGKRHSAGGTKYMGQDGNAFEVEEGEKIFVLKRHDSARINQISKMNVARGGVPFYELGGGYSSQALIQNLSAPTNNNLAIMDIIKNMPIPELNITKLHTAEKEYNNVRVKSTVR